MNYIAKQHTQKVQKSKTQLKTGLSKLMTYLQSI